MVSRLCGQDREFFDACKGDNLYLAKQIHQKGTIRLNWGLWGACRGGHHHIVDWIIELGPKGNDWNMGLYGACLGGQLKLAKLMLQHGAYDVEYGLSSACKNNHSDLVKLMIENKAATCYCWYCERSGKSHKV